MRAYLREFLSDPRVVGLPRLLWLPILHGIVLRRRPRQAAEKYAAIWTAEGSPLAVYTRRQAEALQRAMPQAKIAYAMRYGEPTIADSLAELAGTDATVVPLYPQYAESTTRSVADQLPAGTRMVREFYDHPGFIAALAAGVRGHWQRHGRGPVLIMSFHGLPKRGAARYEQQCRATAALLQRSLGLADSECRVTFQSRFGYAEWLQPYTEATLRALAAGGTRRVDVCFPGFVSDCLETLEEIGLAGRRVFLQAGGLEFHAVPCLNDSPEWITALVDIARGG